MHCCACSGMCAHIGPATYCLSHQQQRSHQQPLGGYIPNQQVQIVVGEREILRRLDEINERLKRLEEKK